VAKKPAPASASPYDEMSKEACSRLEACVKQKDVFDLDIREGYFFAAPHRAREIRSSMAASTTKRNDEGELQTGLASELSRDFVTELVDAFMPQAEAWAERRPGMNLPDEFHAEAKEIAAKQDPVIFDAIRASNLYSEVPKAFAPDIALGTAALWIDDPRPNENIVTQAVPLHELEINIGPFGDIDDRFVVRHTKNAHVKALVGEAIYDKIPAELREKIEAKSNERTIVRWGFWRLWARRDDVVWQHVVMIAKQVVHTMTLVGEGSCPLLPMRFNPSPEWAFGTGPLIEGLPDFRLLDALEGDKIDHIEISLRPPTGYPDDSFAAVEEGIEPGSAYPIRSGSEGAIKAIFEGGDIEGALFETSSIEDRLRRKFFLGMPVQKGKTPPTATQWIDEMIEKQRRIGTPGMPFWREGPAEIFLRFKFLLEKRGRIEPVQVNGKTVSLEPYNPAQRAAEQQEVAMALRYLSIVGPTWPEEFRLEVNGSKTMRNLAQKMRVTRLVEFRNEEEKKAIVSQITELAQGRQRVEPPGPEAAGGM
jgi:hypothetical protein